MANASSTASIVIPLRDGKVAIPEAFRKELGIVEDTLLRITMVNGELRVKPEPAADTEEGSPGLRALYEYFAPVREEILARGISEEEVNADIDAAIAAVRAERRARRQ